MIIRLTRGGVLRVKQGEHVLDLSFPRDPLLPPIEEPEEGRDAPERERRIPPGVEPPRKVGPPKPPPRVMILAKSDKRAASGVQFGSFELEDLREAQETYLPFRAFKANRARSVANARIARTAPGRADMLNVLVTKGELKSGIDVGKIRDFVNDPSTPVNRFKLVLRTSRDTSKA